MGFWRWRVVGEQEGDACMIDEKTRGSLNIAGELLGVDADALEKSMVSKTMAVRDQEQKYWYSKAQQEVFPDSGVQMKRVFFFRAALCNARVDSDRARRRIRLATHKLRSPSDGKTPREKLGGVPSIVLSFTDLDLQRFPGQPLENSGKHPGALFTSPTVTEDVTVVCFRSSHVKYEVHLCNTRPTGSQHGNYDAADRGSGLRLDGCLGQGPLQPALLMARGNAQYHDLGPSKVLLEHPWCLCVA